MKGFNPNCLKSSHTDKDEHPLYTYDELHNSFYENHHESIDFDLGEYNPLSCGSHYSEYYELKYNDRRVQTLKLKKGET